MRACADDADAVAKHKANISLAKLYNLMVSHLNNDISPVFSAFFPLYLLSKNHDLVRAAQRMSIKFQLKPIARALVQMIFRSNLLFFSLFTWFSTSCCFFLCFRFVCVFFCLESNKLWLAHVFIYFSISHWCAPPSLCDKNNTLCSSAMTFAMICIKLPFWS